MGNTQKHTRSGRARGQLTPSGGGCRGGRAVGKHSHAVLSGNTPPSRRASHFWSGSPTREAPVTLVLNHSEKEKQEKKKSFSVGDEGERGGGGCAAFGKRREGAQRCVCRRWGCAAGEHSSPASHVPHQHKHAHTQPRTHKSREKRYSSRSNGDAAASETAVGTAGAGGTGVILYRKAKKKKLVPACQRRGAATATRAGGSVARQPQQPVVRNKPFEWRVRARAPSTRHHAADCTVSHSGTCTF